MQHLTFVAYGIDEALRYLRRGRAEDLRLALVLLDNAAELQQALALKPELIGINHRDLQTFKTSLNVTYRLLDEIPAEVSVITESGILARTDVEEMLDHGVYGFLVGESFMRATDPGWADGATSNLGWASSGMPLRKY